VLIAVPRLLLIHSLNWLCVGLNNLASPAVSFYISCLFIAPRAIRNVLDVARLDICWKPRYS
jgi:hypothetical protein